MRAGIGNVCDGDINENNFMVQMMGCIHTLIEHACGVAVIYKLHNKLGIELYPDDIRKGIIYEMVSPKGIGGQLMHVLSPLIEGDECANEDVLQSIDTAVKSQLMRNVMYASRMLTSGRFEEYKDTLADVAMCHCDLDSIIEGMPVAEALQGSSFTSDNEDVSSDSDETSCHCDICRQWPTLEDNFKQWDPPPGLASICAASVNLIGDNPESE